MSFAEYLGNRDQNTACGPGLDTAGLEVRLSHRQAMLQMST